MWSDCSVQISICVVTVIERGVFTFSLLDSCDGFRVRDASLWGSSVRDGLDDPGALELFCKR